MGRFFEKHVWSKIDCMINDIVDSVTLEDLVREYKSRWRSLLLSTILNLLNSRRLFYGWKKTEV